MKVKSIGVIVIEDDGKEATYQVSPSSKLFENTLFIYHVEEIAKYLKRNIHEGFNQTKTT